jgi:hypothetical protein
MYWGTCVWYDTTSGIASSLAYRIDPNTSTPAVEMRVKLSADTEMSTEAALPAAAGRNAWTWAFYVKGRHRTVPSDCHSRAISFWRASTAPRVRSNHILRAHLAAAAC